MSCQGYCDVILGLGPCPLLARPVNKWLRSSCRDEVSHRRAVWSYRWSNHLAELSPLGNVWHFAFMGAQNLLFILFFPTCPRSWTRPPRNLCNQKRLWKCKWRYCVFSSYWIAYELDVSFARSTHWMTLVNLESRILPNWAAIVISWVAVFYIYVEVRFAFCFLCILLMK